LDTLAGIFLGSEGLIKRMALAGLVKRGAILDVGDVDASTIVDLAKAEHQSSYSL
jgi:hypothetical protein